MKPTSKTRKIKNRNKKYSRKHIGGATVVKVPETDVRVINNNDAKLRPSTVLDGLPTPINSHIPVAQERDNQLIENAKPINLLPKNLNDLRNELIEEISKFDDESFGMMRDNMHKAISNSGSAQYPKKDTVKSTQNTKSISDEIDDFVSSLYDTPTMTLLPNQIYFVDNLLRRYAEKNIGTTEPTVKLENSFDVVKYHYLVHKKDELTKLNSSSPKFKEILRKMLKDVLLNMRQNTGQLIEVAQSGPGTGAIGAAAPSGFSGISLFS